MVTKIKNRKKSFLRGRGLGSTKKWIFGYLLCTSACGRQLTGLGIQTESEVLMGKQVRWKQNAIQAIQSSDPLSAWLEEKAQDKSGPKLEDEIVEWFRGLQTQSETIRQSLAGLPATTLGYPIQYDTTPRQLELLNQWMAQQKEAGTLLDSIREGRYNGLENTIPQEFPVLGAPRTTSYWGNENSACASILHAGLQAFINEGNVKIDGMPGAAYWHRFYDPEFKLPEEVVARYPFARPEGLLLFGDFQFGGHRNFDAQLPLGPEDGSSSVAKATGVAGEVKSFNTTSIRKAWDDPSNPYGYTQMVQLEGSIGESELRAIEPGAIFLQGRKTGIVLGKPDNTGNISTLQFNRDIDDQSMLGGGVRRYALPDMVREHGPILFLRPKQEPLREELTVEAFLKDVDETYHKTFPNGPEDRPDGMDDFLNRK